MFSLPSNIYSPQDISRTIRDIESLSSALRAKKITQQTLPKLPKKLQSLLDTNQIEVTTKTLDELKKWLKEIKKTYPRLKLILSHEPRGSMISKLIIWIQTELEGKALLDIAIDERIVGGFILQTPNHIIDESWKTRLDDAKNDMGSMIRGLA